MIIIDIPVVEKPDETIAYTTTPLGIIIAEKTVITVSMKESPILEELAEGVVKDVQTNLKPGSL